MAKTPDENDWLDLVSVGGEEAWAELARRVQVISEVVWSRWKSPRMSAEELSAEVLFHLLTRLDSLRSGLQTCNSSSIRHAYMQALVYRTAVDLWRKDLRQRAMESQVALRHQRIAESFRDESFGLSEQVQDALQRLPEEDSKLISMRFLENLSLVEIARRLGISYSAAGTRIHRAVNRLRQEFGCMPS